ncbi:uncharacterized protein VP01_8568g1 [Puccinia sorghi]|uniref:Uncharacterized protein n=1 Tax=Puccinia sorghi TaxID=27349 RepID=A0A0L6U8Z5_9BASI|nr:uncharacterized protein VP01_8568g1 [Puccinia sorghi]
MDKVTEKAKKNKNFRPFLMCFRKALEDCWYTIQHQFKNYCGY